MPVVCSTLRACLLGMVFSALLLAGCSPKLNWREVPNQSLGFTATYPDKPVTATREMTLDGLTVPLTLNAVRIDGLIFSVGTVPLDGELAAEQQRLTLALAQSLVNNIGGGQAVLTDKQWASAPAKSLQAEGQLPNGQSATVQAYYVEQNGHLIQVVLMGPTNEINDLVTVPWFRGFSLYGR